jgi:hypothetical protein
MDTHQENVMLATLKYNVRIGNIVVNNLRTRLFLVS